MQYIKDKKFNKKINRKIKSFINCCLWGLNKCFEFKCNAIDKNTTFSYQNYCFWNSDEMVCLIVFYDQNKADDWETDCVNLINSFEWVNPK